MQILVLFGPPQLLVLETKVSLQYFTGVCKESFMPNLFIYLFSDKC